MSQCANCANLQAQVNQLEIENQKLRNEILRLRRIIDIAEATCAMCATEASAVLATHSPRGTWAFAKGKKEAADRISAVLYY